MNNIAATDQKFHNLADMMDAAKLIPDSWVYGTRAVRSTTECAKKFEEFKACRRRRNCHLRQRSGPKRRCHRCLAEAQGDCHQRKATSLGDPDSGISARYAL
jgi:hypothetical protein